MSKELFRKIIQGDEKAFEQVFSKHFKSMCFYLRLYNISLEQSKEIVQYTFLKLWEIRANLEPQGPIENYIYKALRNNSLDYIRSQKIRASYIESIDHSSQEKYNISDDHLQEALAYDELAEKFNSALHNFPPQMREVFMLSRLEGLKYKEIAQRLGISVKTVETHIARALNKLRTDLKEYLPFLLFVFLHTK